MFGRDLLRPSWRPRGSGGARRNGQEHAYLLVNEIGRWRAEASRFGFGTSGWNGSGSDTGNPSALHDRGASGLAQRIAAGDEPGWRGDWENPVRLRVGPASLTRLRVQELSRPPVAGLSRDCLALRQWSGRERPFTACQRLPLWPKGESPGSRFRCVPTRSGKQVA